MTDFHSWLHLCKEQVNEALEKKLPPETSIPIHLHKAMRYAVFNGGKRLRAAFVYATGDMFEVKRDVLHDVAVALELIHAFSLIHDDLPALDNDDLRRGKPTCHLVFGEATAILAGDALQSLAFETLAGMEIDKISAEIRLAMIRILSHATGSLGMIGGEYLDIEMVNTKPSLASIETMYTLKTGSLLSASLVLAALATNCQSKENIYDLAQFGEKLGIAFQIHDDIIGIQSDTVTLGKQQKADLTLNKPVYPQLSSLQKAVERRNTLLAEARKHLERLQRPCEELYALANYVIERNY